MHQLSTIKLFIIVGFNINLLVIRVLLLARVRLLGRVIYDTSIVYRIYYSIVYKRPQCASLMKFSAHTCPEFGTNDCASKQLSCLSNYR